MEIDVEENSAGQQRYGIFLAIFAGVATFVFIGCILLIIFVSVRQSKVPREAVLYYPEGPAVFAGNSSEYLEQTMEKWKRYVGHSLRGDEDAALGEAYSMSELLTPIPNGTGCVILESHRSTCKVRITDGNYEGLTYWVPKKCVIRQGSD